jgi:hypothetical protein
MKNAVGFSMKFLVRWCRDLPCGLRTCAFGSCKRGGACMSRRGLSFDARFCRRRLFKAQNNVVSRIRECKLGAGLSTAHESPTSDNRVVVWWTVLQMQAFKNPSWRL